MSAHTIERRVMNSLLYIRDAQIRELPRINGDSAYWVTTSCVAVSCLPDADGPTRITMGPESQVVKKWAPVFDGNLTIPSGSVVVETVLGEIILQSHVPSSTIRVRIWTNGHRDTDEVTI